MCDVIRENLFFVKNTAVFSMSSKAA